MIALGKMNERGQQWKGKKNGGEDKRGYKYKKGRKKALKMYHLRYKKNCGGRSPLQNSLWTTSTPRTYSKQNFNGLCSLTPPQMDPYNFVG